MNSKITLKDAPQHMKSLQMQICNILFDKKNLLEMKAQQARKWGDDPSHCGD